MTKALYLIVEGPGDEKAAPFLIRRLLQETYHRYEFSTIKALSVNGRLNAIKPGGLEHFLEITRKLRECSGVVVLLDAERENVQCPPDLAINLAERARTLGLPFPIVIVCAACNYESWFLANLHRIGPKYLKPNTKYARNPDQDCGAKGWLSDHMPDGRTYKETQDQVLMTILIDIPHTIQRSRSFRRLDHALKQLLASINAGENIVTPVSLSP